MPTPTTKLGPGAKAALIIGIPTAALAALCCGGPMVLAAFRGTQAVSVASPNASTAAPIQLPSSAPVTATDPPTAEPSPTASDTATSPALTPPPVATTRPAAKPTTHQPTPPHTTGPKYVYGVHPGAFCAPYGAWGFTADNTLMRCEPSATDTRNRWRKA